MKTLQTIKLLITLSILTFLYGCGGDTESTQDDTVAPVITLLGHNSITVFVWNSYTEENATATDDVDGDLSSNIVITGSVDVNTVGTYTLTYQVSDNAGNSTSVTRTVNVQVAPPLNDTGIIWGGNYPSGNNADCTGETIGEQDCSSGRDALATAGQLTKVGGGLAGFDFTKLDANGNPLANQNLDYATQPWVCVQDNHTGLIWEVKTPDVMGTNLHSMNDSFNWYNTDTASNGGAYGSADDDGAICTDYDGADASTFCNTQVFVSRVNASNNGIGLCGATDWRLPNLYELQSISHLGKYNPAIDESYFPNTALAYYWSSSPYSYFAGQHAWAVDFGSGLSNNPWRTNSFRVRLVRIGQ